MHPTHPLPPSQIYPYLHPSAAANPVAIPPESIRNIGIIAHIDAGKTTTTERMLYYVGYTKRIGNVDDGSTVTDYLKMERERGITIQSACIPLAWRNHRINLIDTPGHVDFTIEVERSLRVLDGAVCILDGVAGVEAQTETVWRQANRYNIPRIAFVNKLDREGAHFAATVAAMQERLSGWGRALPLQLPIYRAHHGHFTTKDGPAGSIIGVVDLVTMDRLDWSQDARTGSIVSRIPLDAASLSPEWSDVVASAAAHRSMLVETLAEVDEGIVDAFLECDGDHARIPATDIRAATRRATLAGKIVPVFCGAAFRNLGVQPVLDAVIDYLPSPDNVPPARALTPDGSHVDVSLTDPRMCALAFKVVHDPMRGPIVYIRVYSGTLEGRSVLQIASASTNRNTTPSYRDTSSKSQVIKERATKLLELYADDYEEIPAVTAGNIAAVVGFKHVRTGDTLIAAGDPRRLQLYTIPIPPPVFVRSCEHASGASGEKALSEALANLLREDPSLSLTVDEETGQTLLGGMGELHLEIAGERLREVYKVNCVLGKVEISYRETLVMGGGNTSGGDVYTHNIAYDSNLFGRHLKCNIEIEMRPLYDPSRVDEDVDQGQSGNGHANAAPSTDTVTVHAYLDSDQVSINDKDAQHQTQSNASPMLSRSKGQSAERHGDKSDSGHIPGLWMSLADINALIDDGVRSALTRGPILGFPVSHVDVRVISLGLYGPELSTPAAIRTAAHKCTRAILDGATLPKSSSGSSSNHAHRVARVLEPVMQLELRVPAAHVGAVTKDIAGTRRGQVLDLDTDTASTDITSSTSSPSSSHQESDVSAKHIIHARAPLAELVGYASQLRALTGGSGEFMMKLYGYESMSIDKQYQLVQSIRGY